MLHVPAFRNLSAVQREVVELPFNHSCLVTGGPGTGKTTTAVHRSAWLLQSGRRTTMLMYSRVLSAYSHGAAAGLGAGNAVTTYHKWFHNFWSACYGKSPPMIARWEIDWVACVNQIMDQPPIKLDPWHLVIDEGQDLPRDFYLTLRLMPAYLTVFADEDQRISANQSTVREIASHAGIKSTLTMSRNMRNSRPITEFAAHLNPAARSNASGSPHGPLPQVIRHKDHVGAAEYIARYEREHPGETIGVIFYLAKDLRKFHRALTDRAVNPVQGYVSNRRTGPLSNPAFTGAGIKLMTATSAKGLEFDSVFLPELQSAPGDPTTDDARRKLFVLATRARRNLTLMYSGAGEPSLIALLPKELVDTSIPAD
ncbi:AAA family ATPase [Micromonospora sp. LOL_021]|uniref:AAA family ATPase n=1 Tax=Micromonospora sp. LOL_021 TaxID=3345417 RepID=UPI003A8C6545